MSKQTNIALERGSRAFICGTSGSGKTTLALALMQVCPSPLVILDTKYDPGIAAWARKNGIRIEKKRMPDWRKIDRDLVIRPPADWLSHPEDIDWWLGQAFNCKYIPSIYVDEGYQAGAGSNRMGEGVAGLWTRGRVFGMRLMIGTQRPRFISRFVITESDRIYEGRLMLEDDRKALVAGTGQPAALEIMKPRHFLFIRQDGSEPLIINDLVIRTAPEYNRNNRLQTRVRMRRN